MAKLPDVADYLVAEVLSAKVAFWDMALTWRPADGQSNRGFLPELPFTVEPPDGKGAGAKRN
jgi:hypothetical protein